MNKKIKPFINIGPGQIIKREMESLNWSQEDLSEIIGMSPKSVSQMINNKQSITVETAILLSKAFNTSPEFWLTLEQNYRLRLKEEGAKEKETATKAEIRKFMPIIDMKKKGWISCDQTSKSQVKAYSDFWKQKVPDFSIYNENNLSFCTRQAKSDEAYTKYYTLTWLHKAKSEAEGMRAGAYSKDLLIKLSKEIPDFTIIENGVELFIKELFRAGVKIFVLSHLSKTYLDGASFFDADNPVAVYTARHDRLDNFWWTIAHELAHIILHLKDNEDCFLDNLDERDSSNKKEKEADELAGKMLREEKLLIKAKPYKNYMSENRLVEMSDSCGLHPSVALGILQYNRFVDYRTLNRYKRTVLDLIPEKYKRG